MDIPEKSTTLTFKIKEVANSKFKIVDVDATQLLKDYVLYENLVRSKTFTDKDIYSPETLAAFKIAEGLKARYDSIPWFQHIDDKTYFFVVKGQMNMDYAFSRDTTFTYQMGLLGADQKELIPLAYDLVHNIGATFPNMIEVEKAHKRGFYNINGQLLLPVAYDQIFPLNDNENLALLRKGDDYLWWKKDLTVSEKDPAIQIADVLPRIRSYGKSMKLDSTIMKSVTEYNSREQHGALYVPPSYMVDLGLLPLTQNFTNPLRKHVDYEDVSSLYDLKFEGKTDNESWLSSAFYSIRDNYLGGREGLYTHKNLIVVNKKNNRIYGHDIQIDMGDDEGGGSGLSGKCDINGFKAIDDSLFEVNVGSNYTIRLYDNTEVSGGPGYHYFTIKKDKLVELRNNRMFAFTKYVKMNDDYLNGCYEIYEKKGSTSVNTEMLKYMKNEIYADYKYAFKDKKWAEAFNQSPEFDKLNTNVDDSLTIIDKYNLAFINKKLQEVSNKGKTLAAK